MPQPSLSNSNPPKRKVTELEAAEVTDDEPYVKRPRPDADALHQPAKRSPPNQLSQSWNPSSKKYKSQKKPGYNAKDEVFGQRSMLPVTMNGSDDEPSEDTTEAMTYLQSVRAEAKGLPDTFTASDHPSQTRTVNASTYRIGDARVRYIDGACVAFDDPPPLSKASEAVTHSPQDFGRIRLLNRFRRSRGTTRGAAPRIKQYLESTGEDLEQPATTRAGWHSVFLTEIPSATLLCQMRHDDLFELLRNVAKFSTTRNLPASWSCWIWGVLVNLPDVSDMSSDHVALARDLAKRAAFMAENFQKTALDMEESEVEEAVEWTVDGMDEQDDTQSTHSDEGNKPSKTLTSNALVNGQLKTAQDDSIQSAEASENVPTDIQSQANGAGAEDLEEAKARLLASLDLSHDNASTQTDGSRRNTASLCNSPPPKRKLLSRAEAEAERQRLLKRAKLDHDEPVATEAVEVTQPREATPPVKAEPIEPTNSHTENTVTTTNGNTDVEAKVKPTKVEAKIAAEAQAPFPDENTKATVDMILTIVGECYGQKDLLDCREKWN